jgi:hypothetical protein
MRSHRTKRFRYHFLRYNWRLGLIAAICCAVFGILLLQSGRAATYGVTLDAELGTTSGKVIRASAAGASGSAVTFGKTTSGTPTAPAGLVAITGGKSIAIRWKPSTASSGIREYHIYRDGVKIATRDKSFNYLFPEMNRTGYLDTDVTAGSTYRYQVVAIGGNGTISPPSAALSATQPNSTTPEPEITYELNGLTQLEPKIRDNVIPFLKVWYPKMADQIARPGYTPPASFTINIDPNYNGTAAVWNNEIHVNPVNAADPVEKQSYMGMYLHEATHIIQASPHHVGGYGWYKEGTADWAQEYLLHNREPRAPAANTHYLNGYADASYFINYIHAKYDSSFIRKFNIKHHDNKLTETDFEYGGKTIDQLWAEMTGQKLTLGQVTSPASGKCMDIFDGHTADGNRIRLNPCDGSGSQKVTVRKTASKDTYTLMIHTKCFDVFRGGTDNGTPVNLWGCNNSDPQQWTPASDGTLRALTSGKCLSVANAGNNGADASALEITDCVGADWQKWQLPQIVL